MTVTNLIQVAYANLITRLSAQNTHRFQGTYSFGGALNSFQIYKNFTKEVDGITFNPGAANYGIANTPVIQYNASRRGLKTTGYTSGFIIGSWEFYKNPSDFLMSITANQHNGYQVFMDKTVLKSLDDSSVENSVTSGGVSADTSSGFPEEFRLASTEADGTLKGVDFQTFIQSKVSMATSDVGTDATYMMGIQVPNYVCSIKPEQIGQTLSQKEFIDRDYGRMNLIEGTTNVFAGIQFIMTNLETKTKVAYEFEKDATGGTAAAGSAQSDASKKVTIAAGAAEKIYLWKRDAVEFMSLAGVDKQNIWTDPYKMEATRTSFTRGVAYIRGQDDRVRTFIVPLVGQQGLPNRNEAVKDSRLENAIDLLS